ncbi:MAG: metal-sensing transcriptional repressor [Clostridiaceae bacterium]|nr:metal-sensing transcriptional repressor [Eubacteriales bacterium]
MRQCMDSDNLHRRMKKILGQVNAVDKMIDEDVPCEDILIQINAVKNAMHKVGQIVLEGHLQHCVKEGLEHGDAERTTAEFAKAVEQFSRMS